MGAIHKGSPFMKRGKWSLILNICYLLLFLKCEQSGEPQNRLEQPVMIPRETLSRMKNSIETGLNYIKTVKPCEEEFGYLTKACWNTDPPSCIEYCDPYFYMANSLFALASVDPNLEFYPGKDDLVKFVFNSRRADEGICHGFWDMWAGTQENFDPDIDLSALALIFLNSNGYHINMVRKFDALPGENGLPYTWIRCTPGQPNSIDCGCLSSLMRYYASEGVQPKRICDYLNDLKLDFDHCDTWYPDYITWFFLAQAYAQGAKCLEPSRERIIKTILSRQKSRGGWADPNISAFYSATLAYLRYAGPEIIPALNYLVNSQKKDGSWQCGLIYHNPIIPGEPIFYFMNEVFTTSVALFSLNYYYEHPILINLPDLENPSLSPSSNKNDP